jgi:hypothetical protein
MILPVLDRANCLEKTFSRLGYKIVLGQVL